VKNINDTEMLENPVTDIFEAAGTGLEVASM
jgi:hypothetical protein